MNVCYVNDAVDFGSFLMATILITIPTTMLAMFVFFGAFTKESRLNRAHMRLVHRRVAPYVAAGLSYDDALKRAERELREEALEVLS